MDFFWFENRLLEETLRRFCRVVAEVRSHAEDKWKVSRGFAALKHFQNLAKMQRGFSLKTRKVPPEIVWDSIVWSFEVPWLVWEPDWRRPAFWNTRRSADPVFEVIRLCFDSTVQTETLLSMWLDLLQGDSSLDWAVIFRSHGSCFSTVSHLKL